MQCLAPRPYLAHNEKETTIQHEYIDLIGEASAKWPNWEAGKYIYVCTTSPGLREWSNGRTGCSSI